MYHYPPRVTVYTLPGQDEHAVSFGKTSRDVRAAMEYLCTRLIDRCGKAPTHFWMPLDAFIRIQQDKALYTAIEIQGVKLFSVQGMIGIHAAYMRPEIKPAEGAFIGYPHSDLKSCPEYYAVLVPKAFRMLADSQLQDVLPREI